MRGNNKCQGLAEGPCPHNKCDNTVKICQGDLMLCKSCEVARINEFPNNINKQESLSAKGPVINTLLTYIAFSMLSSTHEAIKKAVVGFFTLTQITEAKDMLYEIISKEVTGDKVHRRDSLLRSEAEAHTTDILSVMSKMDRENIMPLFVVDYKHVGDMPKSKPEEMCNISMCDRLNKVEDKLLHLNDNMDSLLADNQLLRAKLESISIESKETFANVVSKKVSKQAGSSSSLFSKTPQDKLNSPPMLSTAVNQSTMKAYEVSGATNKMQDDGFIIPRYHRQKPKAVIGKATNNTSIKAAPEPGRDLFIFRTDKSTTTENLKSYITECGISVRDITILSHSDAAFNSFKVTVPVSQVEKTLDPEMWPQGIGIRRFWRKRNKAVVI
jgi:hypothetical protein